MADDDQDEQDFSVDGIACRVLSNHIINVGVGRKGTQWSKKLRLSR